MDIIIREPGESGCRLLSLRVFTLNFQQKKIFLQKQVKSGILQKQVKSGKKLKYFAKASKKWKKVKIGGKNWFKID